MDNIITFRGNKMKVKQTKYYLFYGLLIVSLLVSNLVFSGTINDFNRDYITTDLPPYTTDETYHSVIYTDINKITTHGSILWVESDVQNPGFNVVNDDDVNMTNCLMTAGFNPDDMTVKQCSDPFQYSKRFKLNVTSPGTYLDFVFDVDGTMDTRTYRILEKVLNNTGFTISDFKIELGFGDSDNFVSATSGIGLDFSDNSGNIWLTETVTGDVPQLDLDALFPFGLFGDADTDPNQDIDGYFDPNDRARFYLTANRGRIESTGISSNYHDLVGDFMTKANVLNGYFYDHDNDIATDPILIAHQNDLGWITFRVEPFWSNLGLTPPPLNIDGTITNETISQWESDPLFGVDAIEDLANLNMNYHITVGDISLWPTYEGLSNTAKFTLRITSRSIIFANGFELIE